ncbi:NUDIX hydrolase [Phenylobacterium sp.]|uniref:NUDIX domain-containing protein n=1 Tax=Phenylobacterium sp. TaxID=1871053 RepID=UPI0025EEB084|nr:NUDIX hydrolase [Phenylobacterium sp.]
MRNLAKDLNTGAGIVSLVVAVLSAAIKGFPEQSNEIAGRVGIPAALIEPQASLAFIVGAMLVLLLTLLIRARLERNRDHVADAVERYRKNATDLTSDAAGGRVVDIAVKEPTLMMAGKGETWETQVNLLAEAYKLDAAEFAAEVARRRSALKHNASHLILQDPPWLEAHGGNDWREPGANTSRLTGFACDYAMIQALTDAKFARHPKDPWRDVARVSGNTIFVSKEKQCLILHRRARFSIDGKPMAFGGHLHMVGGNFEPSHDGASLAETACREAKEEIGLKLIPHNVPCLLMREDGTNWHMAVFLGVEVGRDYLQKHAAGALTYQTWEGDPEVISFRRLEEILRTNHVVPTCYQAVVAWLLAGAPVSTGGSAMWKWRAVRLGKRLAKIPAKFRREGVAGDEIR